MSEISEAFDDAIEAQNEVLGERQECVIAGVAHDFLVGDTSLVDIPTFGGNSQSGAFIGKVRLSEFAAGLPAKFSPFSFRGYHLQVLSVQRVNESLEIIAGDPTEGEE